MRIIVVVFVVLQVSVSESNAVENENDICASGLCSRRPDLKLIWDAYEIATKYPLDLKSFEDVYNLVEKVREIQPKNEFLERSHEERIRSIEPLKEWCKTRLHGLEISDFPGVGLGLKVMQDIPADQRVSTVLINETLHWLDALKMFEDQKNLTEILKPKEAKYRVLWKRHAWLALRLISEHRNPNSKHALHIATLPTHFNIFAYFTPDDMSYLLGSQAFNDSIHSYFEVVRQYALIYRYIAENSDVLADRNITPDIFTFDYYRWAWTIILTRGYEDESNHIVIPCWDMVNHGKNQMETEIKYKSVPGTQYGTMGDARAWATQPLKANDQLYHEYNDMISTIDHFFNTWGMIEPRGSLHLRMTLQYNDPLYYSKLRTLERLDYITSDEVKLMSNYSTLIYDLDYPFLLAMSTGAHPDEATQNDWSNMWHFLVDIIDYYLKFYKYDLNACKNLLQRNDLSANARLAVTEVLTEQEFLLVARAKCLDLANGPMLEIDWQETEDDYDDEVEETLASNLVDIPDVSISSSATADKPREDL